MPKSACNPVQRGDGKKISHRIRQRSAAGSLRGRDQVATPDGRKIEQLSGTSAAARSVIHRHTVRFIWHGASRILLCALFSTLGCRHTRTHTGTGDVLAVDEQHLIVTIRHDDVPDLMPAMTMDFPVASPEVLAGVSAGMRVRFDVLRDRDTLTVTRLLPAGMAEGVRPGLHDHRPHHGGVVAMAGLLHLEAS